ncbi:helix-turn-helix domain-containing protein [Pseudobacteroides cellulosolvens]|uniref:Transcriptional regulator, AraC family n=1 Tax=Pseudobacteroides cellulosolvens ATCC 35603 = DSM 2933 TaxID=398512 RepID=A0A0L6JJ01_9FIRM|nr:AraC family transcriptional regulator [Pseudobacteroides cellulosolvens]KNY25432.1 transcriptional regulator, AraC family [Pseudobacteroides cellulosolvens ATCC 35603 = DSM 2933]
MSVMLKKINVKNEEIAPRVLTAALFYQGANMPKGYKLQERVTYDYEFELIVYSNGSQIIDDKCYNVKQGDIIFRKPGQYTQGIMPYSCYLICVDILSNTGKSPKSYYVYNDQDYQNYCVNPILEKIPTIFHPLNMERSLYIFDSILKEFITPSPAADLSLKANILNLMYYLYQDSTESLVNNTMYLSPHYCALKKVIEYINNNLEQKMVLNDLSKVANISPHHFHKIFTNAVGITPNEFITRSRLDKAKTLLTRTSYSVAEIAVLCGFENAPYFSYVFKKYNSLTPLEYKKKHIFDAPTLTE